MTASRFLPREMPRRPDRVHAHVLVAAATPFELSWAGGDGAEPPLRWGTWGNLRVAFAVTGPGPTAAAHALGRAGERLAADLYLSVGVGGAFPRTGLNPGDLAVAVEENDGDLGVEPVEAGARPEPLAISPEGFGPEALRTRFAASAEHLPLLLNAARRTGHTLSGPFATSALVTATAERAERFHALYGAVCETMEGAAVARAAAAAGAAFVEVRGISNRVGPRSRGSWRLEEAARAAGAASSAFLDLLEEAR